MTDTTLEYLKINLLNTAHKSPIELCSGLLSHHQDTSAKKETKVAARVNTPLSKQDKSKASIISKPVVDISVPYSIGDKPQPKIDTENIQFPELQSAHDLALTAIMDPPEPEVKENKKDKKKGMTPETDTKRKFISLK